MPREQFTQGGDAMATDGRLARAAARSSANCDHVDERQRQARYGRFVQAARDDGFLARGARGGERLGEHGGVEMVRDRPGGFIERIPQNPIAPGCGSEGEDHFGRRGGGRSGVGVNHGDKLLTSGGDLCFCRAPPPLPVREITSGEPEFEVGDACHVEQLRGVRAGPGDQFARGGGDGRPAGVPSDHVVRNCCLDRARLRCAAGP